jgi:hypothetical protein
MPYGTVSADLVVGTNGGRISPENTFGMRNRIINGAMVINQRGGTITSSGSGTYGVDRFTSFASGGGVYTTQQSSDVPAGGGFINSILSTVTTTDSPTGLDYYLISQFIEGLNIADLGWGTANAKTVTVSFWVKSSIAGTYTVALRNSALNRSYRAPYTINTANTWEQKSLTIAGDTGGTWLTTNGIGVQVSFTLGAGSDYIDTPNAWSAADDFAATGQTQWISTNGATFYITGAQLEVGSNATSFEYRPYGAELALCQRYYVNMNGNGNAFQPLFIGTLYNTTSGSYIMNVPVPMRTVPSITTSGTIYAQNLSINVSSLAGPYSQIGSLLEGDFTLASASTSGNFCFVRWNNIAFGSRSFNISAEL